MHSLTYRSWTHCCEGRYLQSIDKVYWDFIHYSVLYLNHRRDVELFGRNYHVIWNKNSMESERSKVIWLPSIPNPSLGVESEEAESESPKQCCSCPCVIDFCLKYQIPLMLFTGIMLGFLVPFPGLFLDNTGPFGTIAGLVFSFRPLLSNHFSVTLPHNCSWLHFFAFGSQTKH